MPDPSNVQFRAYRRETGLIQEDFAFLLGFKDASAASRIERFERDPDFRTALSCQHVLNIPVSVLFKPLFEATGRLVRERAQERLKQLAGLAHDLRHTARLDHLYKLAEQPRTLFDV